MASSVRAVLVPTEDVPNVWGLVEPLLAASAERCGERLGHWVNLLAAGNMQLWIAWSDRVEAAVVTEIVTSQTEKTCNVVACGGFTARRWVHLLNDIEDWARANGCTLARIVGREGWQRMFPDYERVGVVLDKRL